MTFEVIFTISQPLNFLGYARSKLDQRGVVSSLGSRDVEVLFARDEPVDMALAYIPQDMKEVFQEYEDPFLKEWPSIHEDLVQAKKQLQMLWDSNCQKVITLMEELGFFYSGIIEVFPVMPFFREWPRSNPLSMPAMPWTDKERLTLLIHEILHRTTDAHHLYSLWHYLGMMFFMKKVPKGRRFLLQHALIYVASTWIASHTLKEEFEMPEIKQKTSQREQFIEMKDFIDSLFILFSSKGEEPDRNVMSLAEEIAACCSL
ncbi:MAG: hypothetical protein HXS44_02180 [Theionarchaea archaeon]|nr:hypothetical protein [Theionarchaea archaeon]